MTSRPAIPLPIQREVLLEARHRCAVCCEPTPLERAHIYAWSRSKDHSAANLIALCANCHTRADNENWGQAALKRYKQIPCALAANAAPVLPADKKALVDFIVASDIDSMTDAERVRFVSMTAAYAGVQVSQVSIVSITPSNSVRVRAELPLEGAQKLIAGFNSHDPLLHAFFAEFETEASDASKSPLLWIEPVAEKMPNSIGPTDTSEQGLENLICASMAGSGWIMGRNEDYEREYAIDLMQLRHFLEETQPKVAEGLGLEQETPLRRRFLARLQGEITRRGVIDVLRKGIGFEKWAEITLFFPKPSKGNTKAIRLQRANRFSITRQLRYSRDETRLALDLCLFVNGLPVITFELKNRLTKQTVEDAVEQYKRDRLPSEPLFAFKRCLVHLAVDDQEVRMCPELKGKTSWFLPLNQGWNDGAGNPPNPYGLKTDFLWKRILTPSGLSDILENYALVISPKDLKTGRKKKEQQIFPRFHQLDVVRRLLTHTHFYGAGRKYLIQHSAGSGKSNSIAWLAHQLISLRRPDETGEERDLFDSILVITDRRILDQQLSSTLKNFTQVGATVGHAERSGDLRNFIQSGKKIIVTTVQKFPFILREIGSHHRDRRFAIIIDEAHSSQGSRLSSALSRVLGTAELGADADAEDLINYAMESRRLASNASYFAFTATPKNKTLEIFGTQYSGDDGEIKRRPFHSYTMKQAIQERFIIDVLQNYTPVDSYYKLVKTVEADPKFDTKKAQKKLRRYVEGHEHAIRLKAEIMVDHFHEQVLAHHKIGGQARAMVVTSGIERAIQYFFAFQNYLQEIKSPYQAVVAFSGEHEWNGEKVTEASLNGFPSNQIADRIPEDPYRFLICADKFQTGYDEPLLHTMYVDKALSGIKAVQTLSRLNRAHPQKHDAFVLDFYNDTEIISAAFADYYRTTILSGETDANKLHNLKSTLDDANIYTPEQVEEIVELYLGGASREKLDPILDACVALYIELLDEEEQVLFKSNAKSFNRTYEFLASILPYTVAQWEKLSILLQFLVPKLPAPKEEDLSLGILETIDMDSYRVEKKTALTLTLPDSESEIAPVPTSNAIGIPEPHLDVLSSIIRSFNDQFGNTSFSDSDRLGRMIVEEISPRVNADVAFINARLNSDRSNFRIEGEKALGRAVTALLNDGTAIYRDEADFYKLFFENPSFRRWLEDTVLGKGY